MRAAPSARLAEAVWDASGLSLVPTVIHEAVHILRRWGKRPWLTALGPGGTTARHREESWEIYLSDLAGSVCEVREAELIRKSGFFNSKHLEEQRRVLPCADVLIQEPTATVSEQEVIQRLQYGHFGNLF